MINKTDTWAALTALSPHRMTNNHIKPATLEKIISTVKYSLKQDPSQDPREVARRCKIALMAEQYVAHIVHGYLPTGREDHDNPYSYAYDVVAKDGVRIEVKTHQSKTRWINVNTGMSGDYPSEIPGINLGPFLNHKLADLIIIFDSKVDETGAVLLTPKMLAGRDALSIRSGLIRESNFNSGYYLTEPSHGMENYNYFQFTKQI